MKKKTPKNHDLKKIKTQTVTTRKTLAASAAHVLVHNSVTVANKMGIAVSVAVCGPEMQLIAFLRDDHASPHSKETAIRKAQSAASRKKPSDALDEHLAIKLALATGNALTALRGGLPILVDGECVGGIGVGGGSPDQDLQIATEALTFLAE